MKFAPGHGTVENTGYGVLNSHDGPDIKNKKRVNYYALGNRSSIQLIFPDSQGSHPNIMIQPENRQPGDHLKGDATFLFQISRETDWEMLI